MRSKRSTALAALCIGALTSWTSATRPAQATQPFQLIDINVPNAGVWQLNRAIELRFNQPVDFASVTTHSIAVVQFHGAAASGEYFLKPGDPRTVVFQPHCPLQADYSDAGLAFGGVRYVIEVAGTSGGASAPVSSTSGELLQNGARRVFDTPTNPAPSAAFFDTKPGGPRPIVRGINSDDRDATYVELGGETTQRIYFVRDPATGAISLPADLPLDLLSDPATHVALVIELDQAIDPSASNVDLSRVHWQYRDQGGAWRELEATLELVRNCGGRGATLRLEPIGILPPGAQLRAVIERTLRDIVGQTNTAVLMSFAPAQTIDSPSPLADEHLEEFDTPDFEDAMAVFAEPRASWGAGALSATNGFPGTGGGVLQLDLVVPSGQVIILDTTFASLPGALVVKDPSGNFIGYVAPTGTLDVTGGLLDVDDLWIQTGGVLKVQGPNAVVIAVAGRAQIDGSLDVGGRSNNGVTTLNTTNVPELGAPGTAGGGSGGLGNPLATQACDQGGPGFGAFGAVGLGGQGGETGWSATAAVNRRRGAGGGGGVFGANVSAPAGSAGAFDQRRIGLDAEKGFDSVASDNGALHPGQAPVGGAAGASPFTDSDPTNDFFGNAFDVNAQQVIAGELAHPWAGSGGGGGGNASYAYTGTYPSPWIPTGDEKGAGGGGGAGALHLIALGNVVFGQQGQVFARGGLGGGGENTTFLNRVGGGSGGGSGGHVILESATRINLSALPLNALAIDARGGQGGAGANDSGGATQSVNGQKESLPIQDACPPGYPTTGVNACRGQVDGAGGDGGPGLIQLHTPHGTLGTSGSTADIWLAPGATLAQICAPPPLFAAGAAGGEYLLPNVSSLSRAQSQWIALGHGGFDANGPAGSFRALQLDIAGIDPQTGLVAATNGVVDELPSIVGPLAVQPEPALPYFTGGCGYVAVFDAAPIAASPHAYLLGNDALWRRAALVLSELGNPAHRQRFDVVDAHFDSTAGTLTVAVASSGPDLCSFQAPGGVAVELEPASFRVATNGVFDALPSGASVRIQFQATGADAQGAPDPSQRTPWTSDPAVIDAAAAGTELRFLRFDVRFDYGASALTLPLDSLSLDFLRMPFSY